MIRIRGLTKHYRVHKRPPGLGAAIRSVFHREYTLVKAVDGLDFDVARGETLGVFQMASDGMTMLYSNLFLRLRDLKAMRENGVAHLSPQASTSSSTSF